MNQTDERFRIIQIMKKIVQDLMDLTLSFERFFEQQDQEQVIIAAPAEKLCSPIDTGIEFVLANPSKSTVASTKYQKGLDFRGRWKTTDGREVLVIEVVNNVAIIYDPTEKEDFRIPLIKLSYRLPPEDALPLVSGKKG